MFRPVCHRADGMVGRTELVPAPLQQRILLLHGADALLEAGEVFPECFMAEPFPAGEQAQGTVRTCGDDGLHLPADCRDDPLVFHRLSG